MRNMEARAREVAEMEARAVSAARAGKVAEALALWQQVLQLEPAHPQALDAVGDAAFRRGDLQAALAAYRKLVGIDGSDSQQWINLAVIYRQLKDESGEEEAIRGALTRDPRDLLALLMKGNLLERQGKEHEAARVYGAAATVSPPLEELHPDLRPGVSHAMGYHGQYNARLAAFLDEHLATRMRDFQGEDLRRFKDSIDVFVGRKRRYESQPTVYHYPRLMPVEFFDNARFPWIEGVEAATPGIRDELIAVLASEQGLAPYVTYPADVPLNQWAELNNSPRWSAFHIYKMGRPVDENVARCPRTAAVVRATPQPTLALRTPAAMFSLLKPKTRIPAHTGVTNVRLVTHLGLVVPEGCAFRVGNETRQWVPGKAWVFDDTIEHEAWNDSDQLRVVLIFDTWHPDLSQAERELISATMEGLAEFASGGESFEL